MAPESTQIHKPKPTIIHILNGFCFQSYRGATHGELIVVAGGRDANGTILKAVEIYDEDNGDWVAGPDLPKGLYEPTLTRFGNVGVVLAGEPFDPVITME